MESYVVRIYRRDQAEPQRIIGLLEDPETGLTTRFGDVTELVRILLSPWPREEHAGAVVPGQKSRDSLAGRDGKLAGRDGKEQKKLRLARNK